MENRKKRLSFLQTFAICLGVLFVATIVFLVSTISVSGSVSLPNGIRATINGSFSSSDDSGTTVVEAGGHTFEFSPTAISVNQTVVAPLDSDVRKVEIDASYWKTSLRINGINVPIVR